MGFSCHSEGIVTSCQVFVMFSACSLFSTWKHAGRWIGYYKLPLGIISMENSCLKPSVAVLSPRSTMIWRKEEVVAHWLQCWPSDQKVMSLNPANTGPLNKALNHQLLSCNNEIHTNLSGQKHLLKISE